MAFSAVFTNYDLICLKLSILKTNLFIVENGKKKFFKTMWSQKFTSLFQTSTFSSSIFTGLKSNKIAAKLTKQLWFINSAVLRFIIISQSTRRAISNNMAIPVQLTQQMPSVTFCKMKCSNPNQGMLTFAKSSDINLSVGGKTTQLTFLCRLKGHIFY